MRIAPLADVKARLSAYLDECGVEGPIVITRNGKAVAVLVVPYDEDDLERLLLGRSPRFQALLNRSRQSINEGKGLSEEVLLGGRSQTSTRAKGRGCERPPPQALKLTSNSDGIVNVEGVGCVGRRGLAAAAVLVADGM